MFMIRSIMKRTFLVMMSSIFNRGSSQEMFVSKDDLRLRKRSVKVENDAIKRLTVTVRSLTVLLAKSTPDFPLFSRKIAVFLT